MGIVAAGTRTQFFVSGAGGRPSIDAQCENVEADTMHILTLVMVGLAALGIFVLVGRFASRRGRLFDGARIFIWFWLAASLINAAVGLFHAGIPLGNEIAAFIPIFGIPAGLAWYLSYLARRPAAPES